MVDTGLEDIDEIPASTVDEDRVHNKENEEPLDYVPDFFQPASLYEQPPYSPAEQRPYPQLEHPSVRFPPPPSPPLGLSPVRPPPPPLPLSVVGDMITQRTVDRKKRARLRRRVRDQKRREKRREEVHRVPGPIVPEPPGVNVAIGNNVSHVKIGPITLNVVVQPTAGALSRS